MRAISMTTPIVAMTAATLLAAAPAWAASGVWQWGQMDVSSMQAMTVDQLSAHVGDFVYAADGSIVGTLDSAAGGTAVVHVSSFFQPADPHVSLPGADVGVIGGKLVVHGVSFADVAH